MGLVTGDLALEMALTPPADNAVDNYESDLHTVKVESDHNDQGQDGDQNPQ